MELNKTELTQVEDTSRRISNEAVMELEELQLVLVGGGCEVSFN